MGRKKQENSSLLKRTIQIGVQNNDIETLGGESALKDKIRKQIKIWVSEK